MDASAVYIKYNIVTVIAKLMDQVIETPYMQSNKQRTICPLLIFTDNRFLSDYLFLVFTHLISHRAGCLAGRLAGCLAFAASALFQRVLKSSGIQSLNMFHMEDTSCSHINFE